MNYFFEQYGFTLLPELDSIPEELSGIPIGSTTIPPLDIPNPKLQRYDGYSEWIEVDQAYHDSVMTQFIASQDAELSGTDIYIIKWIDTRFKMPDAIKNYRKSIRDKYRAFFQVFNEDYVEPEKDVVSFSRTFSEIISTGQLEYQNDILKDIYIIHNVRINGEDLQIPAFNATTGTITGLTVTIGDKLTIIFN